MKKVLFVGQFNVIFQEISTFLTRHFTVQICETDIFLDSNILSVSKPDVILLDLLGVGQEKNDIFYELRNNHMDIPLLCLKTADEEVPPEMVVGIKKMRTLKLPAGNERITEVICELLGFRYDRSNGTVIETAYSRKCVLAIDDNEIQLRMLNEMLKAEYDVMLANSAVKALTLIGKRVPDIILLDVMLPKMDGLQVCQQTREFSQVPIIMVTAKGEDMDKIMGLEYGADDYITKPFNILELKARIRALLRRAGNSEKKSPNNTLSVGTITLDLDARNAFRAGNMVDLTAKEFDVVEFLMRNPNRVYSREALLDTIWAYEYRSDIRTVDVHIRRLREKLEENPAEPKHIMTKWGVGYYFKK